MADAIFRIAKDLTSLFLRSRHRRSESPTAAMGFASLCSRVS
jgi:hypothetical protein